MDIPDRTIDDIAALSKLFLNEEEKQKAKKEISKILGYIDTMNELDTSDIEPEPQAFINVNVFREDVVTNGDCRKELLSNAPVKKDGCFAVPKTVQ